LDEIRRAGGKNVSEQYMDISWRAIFPKHEEIANLNLFDLEEV